MRTCGLLFALTIGAMSWARADGSMSTPWDRRADEYPRLTGETSDSGRLQRAIDASPSGVVMLPSGRYEIDTPLLVTNLCSLTLHKNAELIAVKPMEFVVKINNQPAFAALERSGRYDFGMFFTGGRIDGRGIASCMSIDGFWHYKLSDATFLNGKQFGLRVQAEKSGCELMANNLYFFCHLPGLAGNTGVYIAGSDCHYTDCVVVDYTVGFNIAKGGSNRLTRCHVWGGRIPARSKGEPREMLKDSICFKVGKEAGANSLHDCYADTGKVGFEMNGWETRMTGCQYFNNKVFGLDDIVIVRQMTGSLFVANCTFVKSAPHIKAYEGCGRVVWRDILYSCWGTEEAPGKVEYNWGKTDLEKKLLEMNLVD